MAVKVLLPTALRRYANNQNTIEVKGAKVGEAMANLIAMHPDLKTHLFDDDGKMRNFVNVYLNDENIRALDMNDTNVGDGDEITLVPAVAGGSHYLDISTKGVELSKDEIERFSRHLILPEVGMEGQKKIKAASVLLIGTGGLGSPLGMYLSAAGVGRIGLVDFDVVDKSNLQRQVIHGTKDIGRPKIVSAREKINDINPHVVVESYETGLTSENAMEIVKKYDIVIDGTDNFPTRYLVNDACVLLGKPNVYGSIFRFEGQNSVFWAEKGPCYRCLYPEPPPPGMVPSCAEGGVIGILPGIIGLIQANEAIKLIIGQGTPLIGRFLTFNALDMKFRELKLRKDPKCPICGENPTIKELIDYHEFCGVPKASAAATNADEDLAPDEITPKQVKAKMQNGGGFVLIDVREPHEWEIAHIEGAKLIPLSQFQDRIDEIDSDTQVILHCKMGGRSAKAQDILYANGYTNVLNMVGGITRWANEVDPSLPKY